MKCTAMYVLRVVQTVINVVGFNRTCVSVRLVVGNLTVTILLITIL